MAMQPRDGLSGHAWACAVVSICGAAGTAAALHVVDLHIALQGTLLLVALVHRTKHPSIAVLFQHKYSTITARAAVSSSIVGSMQSELIQWHPGNLSVLRSMASEAHVDSCSYMWLFGLPCALQHMQHLPDAMAWLTLNYALD
jgi:hypothetical protein